MIHRLNYYDDLKSSDTFSPVLLRNERRRGRSESVSFHFSLRPVHVTDFTSDRYQILTGSDDYTCRLWDIPNATELTSYHEHTDYIRCGVASKLNRDLFITGEMEAEASFVSAALNMTFHRLISNTLIE